MDRYVKYWSHNKEPKTNNFDTPHILITKMVTRYYPPGHNWPRKSQPEQSPLERFPPRTLPNWMGREIHESRRRDHARFAINSNFLRGRYLSTTIEVSWIPHLEMAVSPILIQIRKCPEFEPVVMVTLWRLFVLKYDAAHHWGLQLHQYRNISDRLCRSILQHPWYIKHLVCIYPLSLTHTGPHISIKSNGRTGHRVHFPWPVDCYVICILWRHHIFSLT